MDFYSVNDYCRSVFGRKLYKISLDGGFTCPNRDGTLGTRGCIFCSRSGSGDFAEHGSDISLQIESAKKRVQSKNRGGGWIAYFQNFTNTYAPAEKLRSLFMPAAEREDIDVLSIATRPDCLEPEKIALLKELNCIKPVWIELGFQTSKPESAEYIRRGYENSVYADSVKRLKQAGIYVITHTITGLPGESLDDMKNTLKFAVDAGTDGVKLQLLHIIKDSDLYEPWLRGEIKTLSMEEYLYYTGELIKILPRRIAVHRITGDGDKRTLAAPLWSADKKAVLNAIKNYPARQGENAHE